MTNPAEVREIRYQNENLSSQAQIGTGIIKFGEKMQLVMGLGMGELEAIAAASLKPAVIGGGAAVTRGFTRFSAVENDVINEGLDIIGSRAFNTIREAKASGTATEVSIGGRTILYEPELPGSGFTLFNENAFVIGPEAFASEKELTSTVMHELFRLKNSTSKTTGVSASSASSETKDAATFAKDVVDELYQE